MVKKLFKILLIVFLFVFLLNAQFSFAQETTGEIKPSGSSEQIMPPPIPKIEAEQTTGQPEISPETTIVSASNTEIQKINQKINYLIGAVTVEFLLILLFAIKICLYKRPKKEV